LRVLASPMFTSFLIPIPHQHITDEIGRKSKTRYLLPLTWRKFFRHKY
jgi:hypothetical protein